MEKDHIALLEKGMEYYPSKYPVGGTKSEITQIKYDNKELFNKDLWNFKIINVNLSIFSLLTDEKVTYSVP